MKIKHNVLLKNYNYKKFDKSLWNELRKDKNQPAFYLDVNQLLENNNTHFSNFVYKIFKSLKTNFPNLIKVFSFGSGKSYFEYKLKSISNYNVMISDYSDSILEFKKTDFFDKVIKMDFMTEELPINESMIIIFSRIDTELEDTQLENLFMKCYNKNIQVIVFIPAQLLTLKVFIIEILIKLKSILNNEKTIEAGYSRSISHFKSIYKNYYKCIESIHLNEYKAFILKKFKNNE